VDLGFSGRKILLQQFETGREDNDCPLGEALHMEPRLVLARYQCKSETIGPVTPLF
jgi:hypothetical protein